jgi:enoyl-CoA hydratase
MDDVVLVDVDERVATVTLNRPEARNALNRALRRRLRAVTAELEADDDVDVVVLTGADPAFCAGIDLKELGGADDTGDDEALDPAERGRGPWRGPIPPLSKPLIGAVNGVAVTGGFELALACDFLVASERARFADTHARVGVMPGWGLTVRLVELVGSARAKEMSITGNFVDAPTALRIGLVNHVVAHDQLLPFVHGLAADCRTIDQRAVRRMLRTYDEVAAVTKDEAWEVEAAASDEWYATAFDRDGVEERRRGIVARGRSQL